MIEISDLNRTDLNQPTLLWTPILAHIYIYIYSALKFWNRKNRNAQHHCLDTTLNKSYYQCQQHRQLTQLFDEWLNPVHHGCVMAGSMGSWNTSIKTHNQTA